MLGALCGVYVVDSCECIGGCVCGMWGGSLWCVCGYVCML